MPQSQTDLQKMYDFMLRHVPTTSGIQVVTTSYSNPSETPAFDLSGRRVNANSKSIIIRNGRLYFRNYHNP